MSFIIASHPAKYLSKTKKNNVIFQLKKAERFITRRPKLYEMFKELQWKKNGTTFEEMRYEKLN